MIKKSNLNQLTFSGIPIENDSNSLYIAKVSKSGNVMWEKDLRQFLRKTDTFTNPFQTGINTSSKVLEYVDYGGAYGNVRFNTNTNFDLWDKQTFSFKIYVPSSSITGSESNQVSLKLQNSLEQQPWTTQSEIIKPIVLDQWQEISFNFQTDNYLNFDPASKPPTDRLDFNRVLIQVNGENNNTIAPAPSAYIAIK